MNRAFLLSSLFTVGLTISGCASINVVEPMPDLARDEADIPTAFAIPGDPVRADSFAALFPDDRLAQFLEDTLAANQDLTLARNSVRIAQAQLKQVKAQKLPFISGGVSGGLGTSLNDFDISDNLRPSASLSWNPDFFGGISAQVDGAEARVAIEDAELARLRRTLLSQTVQAYISTIEADQQLALARENFDFLGETLRVSKARFEAGDTARSNLALSELEYENARSSLAVQELSARSARRALSRLTGGFGEDDIQVGASLPTISAEGLGLNAPLSVIKNRYDVLASRMAVASAVANVVNVRTDRLPRLSLSGGIDGGLGIADLFDIDTYIAALSASLTQDIFDGGLDAARVEEARLRVDNAVTLHERSLRNAYREIADSYDNARVLEQSLSALDAASIAAERALELENIRYDLGETILLDVLQVQQRVNAIQSSRIRTRSRLLQAVSDAYLASGPAN